MSVGAAITRSMGAAILGKAIAVSCGMLTFALLARHLGAEGLGHYRTILSILALGGAIVDLGTYQVTLAELSSPGAEESAIVGNAFTIRWAATSIAVLLAALVAVIAGFHEGMVIGILVGGAGWVAYRVNEWASAIFQHRLVQQRAAAGEIVGVVVTLAAVAVLARTDAGFVAMVGATALGWLVGLAVIWKLARQLVPFVPRFDLPVARKLIVKGLPMGGSKILDVVQLRSDILLLAMIGTIANVGVYDVGLKVYEILGTLAFILGGLLMPLYVGDRSAGTQAIARRLEAAITLVVTISALAIVIVMVHAERIAVFLAGNAFQESGGVLRVIIIAVAFAAVANQLRFAAIAMERQTTMLRVDVVACVSAITAYLILIPLYGGVGAAAGKVLATGVIVLLTLWLLGKELRIRPWRCLPVAVGGAVVLFGLLEAADAVGMNWLAASAVAGSMVAASLTRVPFVRRELSELTRSSPARD
jgi:O-antigen/teichoic acid export membrane protein